MTDIEQYEYLREQARIARREAGELRELHKIATCGLDQRYGYGNHRVPHHIARRVADSYPIWADEYDAIATNLEHQMAEMLTPAPALNGEKP